MKKVIALFAFSVLSTSIIGAACPKPAQVVLNFANNAVVGQHANLVSSKVESACNPCELVTVYSMNFEPDCKPCAPVCPPACPPACPTACSSWGM